MSIEMTYELGEYRIETIVTDEPWCENCYLVKHVLTGDQVLIDPGDSAELIIKTVREQKGELKKILITHAHHDHVGAVSELHKYYGVPCYLHKADARLMRQAHTYRLVFDNRKIEPFASASLLDEEKTLDVEGGKIDVIHSPGHTKGSACYSFGDFVFTGDTVLYKHIGRTDTPGGDKENLVSSVSRLMEQLPEDALLLPGHGRSWTTKDARIWWKGALLSPPQYMSFEKIL